MNEGQFYQLQDEIVAELQTKAFFADVDVLSERRLSIGFKVDELVARLGGLSVVIFTYTGSNATPGVLGPRVEIDVTLLVCEIPTINRGATGKNKPATWVTEEAIRSLHMWKPNAADQALVYTEHSPIENPSMLMIQTTFKSKIHLKSNADLRER